jgi:signal transduction histidine kinase
VKGVEKELDASVLSLPACAETLVGLAELRHARSNLDLTKLLLADPGVLLTVLQHFKSPHLLPDSTPENASRLLELFPASHSLADWNSPRGLAVYQFSQHVRQLARTLAETIAPKDWLLATQAEIVGVLSNLGAQLAYLGNWRPKPTLQMEIWTRKILRVSGLPDWLVRIFLSLDQAHDLDLGCDRRLLLLLQTALGLVQEVREETNWSLPYSWREAARLLDGLGSLHDSANLEQLQVMVREDRFEAPKSYPGTAELLWRSFRMTEPPESSANPRQLQAVEEAEKLRGHLRALRQRQEQELRRRKLQAMAEFAAGAGHEINNPLAVLSTQAQYLLRGEEDLERIRSLERIVQQTRRIHQLLRGLMFFARPPEPTLRSFPLASLLQQAETDALALALGREVHLELKAPKKSLRIHGDFEMLRTALGCLVRNAIEAAPPRGWVRLSSALHEARLGESWIEIRVEDNGPGIADGVREHIFDPFFSGRSAGRGVGLGLCQAWRAAELHHGQVHFVSEQGQPTRFMLTLPTHAPLKGRSRQSPNMNGTANI